MILKEIDNDKIDYQAYGNVVDLYTKNIGFFDELSNEERKLQLKFLYDLFTGFPDKGSEYKKTRFNSFYGSELRKRSGDDSDVIRLFSCTPNYINARIIPDYDDEIVIDQCRDKITLSANMALNDKLKTVISGEQMPDTKSKLNIITADYNYKITGAPLFSLFGELKDCVISQQELEDLSKSTNNSRYALHNFMKTKYPFLDDIKLQRFINMTVEWNSSYSYYHSRLSNYAIEKYLQNYVEEVEKGYIEGANLQKEAIEGLDLGEDAIKKFAAYEVIDIYGRKNKLMDIAICMQDYNNDLYYCPFFDALNKIPKEDVDVYIVGLCYFATYCDEVGRVDAHNQYGKNTARRLSGEKLNIAIKSSLLGVKVADYAQARETYNETDFIIRSFFNEMGFGNTVSLGRKPYINIDAFKEAIFPYLIGRMALRNRMY